jgi:hypothetical protein
MTASWRRQFRQRLKGRSIAQALPRPGVEQSLAPLAQAGANLEFVIARRAPEKPGTGVVFVTPIKGARQLRAAKAVGFTKTESLHSPRAQGPDKPGLGAWAPG